MAAADAFMGRIATESEVKKRNVDAVRASRDGHEFHEAWAARKALQLVLPTNGLIGIALEGFSPADQNWLSSAAVDIADVVLYYGKQASFDGADSTVVVQVKYSYSSQEAEFRAADAKKTIKKFAEAFKDHKKRFGSALVAKKLSFELLTNRPIYPALLLAIEDIGTGKASSGQAKPQAKQFVAACGLSGKDLSQFAAKVRITGLAGNLRQNKEHLARVLADWSAATDTTARLRLGQLKALIRDKAGLTGQGQNLIREVDVLGALELQDAADLMPCDEAFPEVGPVVPRAQLQQAFEKILALPSPLLVHADGGVGKTVFLQSLATLVSQDHEVELFDCFGGGAYRAPEDARHLPRRGLIHLANRLACRGLCDPLLPGDNDEDLIKGFRRRLEQTVGTIQRGSPAKQLVLFVDAIDNAAIEAKDRNQRPFPKLLLESFHRAGPVAGVKLVVSCRTHRRNLAKGDVPCEELQLSRFTEKETAQYLIDRIPDLTDTQIHVAHSRSLGNARILEHLARGDRSLLAASEIDNVIQLDDLLRDRIESALSEARTRGSSDEDINSFLAGLSVLPAPVPLSEYADAHSMDLGAVNSFAVDLSPLLEQTRYGLMFRDEPTESLVRERYAADDKVLRKLADNLWRRQDVSVYAATALPPLLEKLNDGKRLFELAFDSRLPATITSTVGKRRILYARLKAATLHATRHQEFNRLVHLLVELSGLAATNRRGTEYIVDNPDLVVVSNDADAMRRLVETRTRWPGTRHARLAIANALTGDLSAAMRHAGYAYNWIEHFYRQDDNYRRDFGGPEAIDAAALPFCLAVTGRQDDAALFLTRWRDWFAFEVGRWTLLLLAQARTTANLDAESIGRFVANLPMRPGALASAISFLELDDEPRRKLVGRLGRTCQKQGPVETSGRYDSDPDYGLREGLLKSAGVALSLGQRAAARHILSSLPATRPHIWSLADYHRNIETFYFVVGTALSCAAEGIAVTEPMLLPEELVAIGTTISSELRGEPYRQALSSALTEAQKAEQSVPKEKREFGREFSESASRFLAHRLEALVQLTQAMNVAFASRGDRLGEAFAAVLGQWEELRTRSDGRWENGSRNHFFEPLGRQCLTFLVWTRSDLSVASVDNVASRLTADAATPTTMLIRLVSMLSNRPALHDIAGRIAQSARAAIQREDDVVHRGSLFADLARAIALASAAEATTYFRIGLEQMDAIGSGDYRFVNELLNFAGVLSGPELDESEFHTLSNICELNLHDDEKFPWLSFGQGLSHTSAYRTLARLGRWADRGKVSLDYTLLPYLSGLVEQNKMAPALAVGLLRVSTPVEYHDAGTEHFAQLIVDRKDPDSASLLRELILQHRQSHPQVFMPRTLSALLALATQELGEDSEEVQYLRKAAPRFETLRDQDNHRHNSRSFDSSGSSKDDAREQETRRKLTEIEDATDPTSEDSLARAAEAMEGLGYIHDLREESLTRMRNRVPFARRTDYIRAIARVPSLSTYAKLRELEVCKREWGGSSAAIDEVFREIALPLLRMHADDLVGFDYLSTSQLHELSKLSGVSIEDLALTLVEVFAAPNADSPPSVWLSLATILNSRATEGEGQKALGRLLMSNAAQLASNVEDGPWKPGLYPNLGKVDAAAGLVWLTLGSPSAAQRWHGGHSIRSLARLGQWDVLGALVKRIDSHDANPHQAPELPFFFLHARLWLLIALARVAKDYPHEIAAHAPTLRRIAVDADAPHILMRYFAAQAVLECADADEFSLSVAEQKALKAVAKSPFRRKKTTRHTSDSFYSERPDSIPEPKNAFHLDYDFDKYDVSRLSDIFHQSRWRLKDDMTKWVRRYDPKVRGMYEEGGRALPYRLRHSGSSDRYHTYGYQLGWHALFAVADTSLQHYPVFESRYEDDDPLAEWLSRKLLTRKDGLWLADGVDWLPVDAQVNLLEPGDKTSAVTGSDEKLLGLLDTDLSSEVVIAGDWPSNDNVSIKIQSALAPRNEAARLALELSQEDPFLAWLPSGNNDEPQLGSDDRPYEPWAVWYGTEGDLDDTDPFGVSFAQGRLRLTDTINTEAGLKTSDPFRRVWRDKQCRVVVRSEAWGRSAGYDDERVGGRRLIATSEFLKSILDKHDADLVVLVLLRYYISRSGDSTSEYWHTMATVRIDKGLTRTIYHGVTNELHKNKY